MKNNWVDLDIQAMVKSLGDNIRNFGGFSPAEVRKAGRLSDVDAQSQILRALESGPKTGNEILQSFVSGATGPKVSAGQIYPLLENLLDTKLVSAEIKKDRRIFSLTKSGAAAITEAAKEQPASGEEKSSPAWIDLKGDVAKAGARLATVLIEVSRNGSKEQQQKAAEVANDARRKIYEILSTD